MKKGQVVIFILSILIIGIIFVGINNSVNSYDDNKLEMIENNIRKALITCYSSEGFYPSDINYLKENYSLVIDDSVNVFYQAVGSNIFPDFMVSYKEKKSWKDLLWKWDSH